MLFNFKEYLINGYSTNLISLLFVISLFFAISVIITKNPVMSILFLIVLFICVASYLLSIGIIFIGLSYLLIYVGAVSILFLFILMLINIRVSELISETYNSIPLAIIIAYVLCNILYNMLPSNINLLDFFYNMIDTSLYNNEILMSSNNYWDSNIVEFNNIASLGNIIYTDFSIWLVLTSLILLLAMVGAIVITIKTPLN